MFVDGETDDEVMLDLIGDTLGDAVTGVLIAWRRDVESEPIGQLVDMDAALAAIKAGRRSRLIKFRRWF